MAERLAAQSDAVADAIAANDGCLAAERVEALRTSLSEVDVPDGVRREVERVASREFVCPPPPAPPAVPADDDDDEEDQGDGRDGKEKDRDKHKDKNKEGKDDGKGKDDEQHGQKGERDE